MSAIIGLGIGFLLGILTIVLLGLKWEFDKPLLLVSSLCIGILAMGISSLVKRHAALNGIALAALTFALILALFAAYILIRFFRNPERKPAGDETHILSPADGKVIYIKNIEQGAVPTSEKHSRTFRLEELLGTDLLTRGGCLVGISMSFLDVHVNRAPISGSISLMHHVKGRFFSLKKAEAVFRNERAVTIIESDKARVGMVQIASRLVRSIVAFKKAGEEVTRGERIGMIRFGSQVDLVLPESPRAAICIKVGEKVKAGESILGQFLTDSEE